MRVEKRLYFLALSDLMVLLNVGNLERVAALKAFLADFFVKIYSNKLIFLLIQEWLRLYRR
jgi:hypothetical protein